LFRARPFSLKLGASSRWKGLNLYGSKRNKRTDSNYDCLFRPVGDSQTPGLSWATVRPSIISQREPRASQPPNPSCKVLEQQARETAEEEHKLTVAEQQFADLDALDLSGSATGDPLGQQLLQVELEKAVEQQLSTLKNACRMASK
jgi:hypothetical protein